MLPTPTFFRGTRNQPLIFYQKDLDVPMATVGEGYFFFNGDVGMS